MSAAAVAAFQVGRKLEPYVTLFSLGIKPTNGPSSDGASDDDDSHDDSDDDSDDDFTPTQVQNAARLLATVAGAVADRETDEAVENRLLSAHCCHGCMSEKTITELVRLTEIHVAKYGWLTKRHSVHPTTDFSLLDAPEVLAVAQPVISSVVLPTLYQLYFDGDHDQVKLEINDLFYVRYDGDTAKAQKELEPHRDGSLLSFSIALTSPDAFVGGGTRFVGSGKVLRPMEAGDLVTHSGKILHSGEKVDRGMRDILVGFVTATGPAINEVFLASHMVTRASCSDAGILDLAIVNGALISTALRL